MKTCLLLLLLPAILSAQPSQSSATVRIPSQVYHWADPDTRPSGPLSTATLFSGPAADMEYLSMAACQLRPTTSALQLRVPAAEEHLLIIKTGVLQLSLGDSLWRLGPASVAVLMPGEEYALETSDGSQFYRMAYRSRLPPDPTRAATSGGSFVVAWEDVPFRAHDKGGIRRFFEQPTLMCRRFEMHVTTLKSGLSSHAPHTHRAEEIVLMLEDDGAPPPKTSMQIGEKFFTGHAGDIFYLGSNVPHAIANVGSASCTYFAFQFE